MLNKTGSLAAAACLLLAACAKQQAPAVAQTPPPPLKPVVTLQDLMQSVVDPSADVVWDATGSISDATGIHDLSPKNDEEWTNVRNHAVMLVEAMNLLMIEHRQVAAKPFPKDPVSGLSSDEIQQRIDSQRSTFNGFAAGMRDVALQMLEAVDKRDVEKMSDVGGTIDEVCETCHQTFWYPSEKKK